MRTLKLCGMTLLLLLMSSLSLAQASVDEFPAPDENSPYSWYIVHGNVTCFWLGTENPLEMSGFEIPQKLCHRGFNPDQIGVAYYFSNFSDRVDLFDIVVNEPTDDANIIIASVRLEFANRWLPDTNKTIIYLMGETTEGQRRGEIMTINNEGPEDIIVQLHEQVEYGYIFTLAAHNKACVFSVERNTGFANMSHCNQVFEINLFNAGSHAADGLADVLEASCQTNQLATDICSLNYRAIGSRLMDEFDNLAERLTNR